MAAGAALAAVAGASVVARAVVGSEPDDTASAPSRTRVTTIDDAAPASARQSRRIWRELAGPVRTVGVPWPSDAEARVVIGTRSTPTSVEVVDRRTGDRTSLPTPWEGHSLSVSPVRVTPRAVWVSWVQRVAGVPRPAALRYEVTTGRHEVVLAPPVPHHVRASFTSPLAYGDDDRFYFRTYRPGHDGPDSFTHLWSFAADAPRSVRPEGGAQQWTVAGSLLAALDHEHDGGPITLRVRDLATGAAHTRNLDDCDDPYLEASSAYVVVDCRDAPAVLVLDRDLEPLARLQVPRGVNVAGFGPPSLHVGERWISIGRLAYEPDTGRSLRLREPPARS